MARNRTTKAVAQRIDLNYFKRATPFKRAKLWLAILAPAVALVWIGWHFLGGDQRVYSSGRLSEAHAVLEKQCAACHVPESGGFSAKAADAACLACHDGPAHHPEVTASNVPKQACAECHSEHRGRVNLAATNERNCAECHRDLAAAGPGSQFVKNIRSLADGHPEFAALRNGAAGGVHDPGTIKLNHALHMRSIRRGPTGPMVQLECGDCHKTGDAQPTSWRFADRTYVPPEPLAPLQSQHAYDFKDEFLEPRARGLLPARPASQRERMAPLKFANTCAGCHLLTFDKRFDDGVPHDTPQVIHEYLVKRFAKYIATHPSELRQMQDPERAVAGRDRLPTARVLTAAQWVAERVAVSQELLWHKTCAQCHGVSGSSLQDVSIARWDAKQFQTQRDKKDSISLAGLKTRGEQESLAKIAPAKLTLQWLPHARFDHDAHTGFACTGCHQNAMKSTESSDILVPGIAVCQTCHAPGPGYTSAECAECHTYHDWSKRKEVKPSFVMPGLKTGGN
jgi:hypothetical protein